MFAVSHVIENVQKNLPLHAIALYAAMWQCGIFLPGHVNIYKHNKHIFPNMLMFSRKIQKFKVFSQIKDLFSKTWNRTIGTEYWSWIFPAHTIVITKLKEQL